MPPKVFIPNIGCHDFSAATKYGTLVPLTKGRLKLLSVGSMYRTLLPALQDSSPDDYILVCGPTIINIVATTIFSSLHGKVNLLIYHVGKDGKGRYYRRNITFNNMEVPE